VIRRAALLAVVVLAAVALPYRAGAQSPGTTTIPELPEPHIIPEPNSGHAPEDAGDRGGALQLVLLAVVVVGVGGGVAYVVHQSRRARST
jgi:hypothetical protein